MKLKITTIGNSVGVILPEVAEAIMREDLEVLRKLRISDPHDHVDRQCIRARHP